MDPKDARKDKQWSTMVETQTSKFNDLNPKEMLDVLRNEMVSLIEIKELGSAGCDPEWCCE